jgi:hypothetical protein
MGSWLPWLKLSEYWKNDVSFESGEKRAAQNFKSYQTLDLQIVRGNLLNRGDQDDLNVLIDWN